jgi:hypothetical protein
MQDQSRPEARRIHQAVFGLPGLGASSAGDDLLGQGTPKHAGGSFRRIRISGSRISGWEPPAVSKVMGWHPPKVMFVRRGAGRTTARVCAAQRRLPKLGLRA